MSMDRRGEFIEEFDDGEREIVFFFFAFDLKKYVQVR